jgi:hypothetical protein
MDAEQTELRIERVKNGWIVSGWTDGFTRREQYQAPGHYVAVTPGHLSSMIFEWATSQQKTDERHLHSEKEV